MNEPFPSRSPAEPYAAADAAPLSAAGATPIPAAPGATPMMEQFIEIKAGSAEWVVLYG